MKQQSNTQDIRNIVDAVKKVLLNEAEAGDDDVLSSRATQDVKTDMTDEMPTPDTEKDVKTTDADAKVRPVAPTSPTIKENDIVAVDEGDAKGWSAIVRRISGDRLTLLVYPFIKTPYESKVELQNYPLENVSILPKEDENYDYLSLKVSSGRPAIKEDFVTKAKKFLKGDKKVIKEETEDEDNKRSLEAAAHTEAVLEDIERKMNRYNRIDKRLMAVDEVVEFLDIVGYVEISHSLSRIFSK
jgi:hypothetical protein